MCADSFQRRTSAHRTSFARVHSRCRFGVCDVTECLSGAVPASFIYLSALAIRIDFPFADRNGSAYCRRGSFPHRTPFRALCMRYLHFYFISVVTCRGDMPIHSMETSSFHFVFARNVAMALCNEKRYHTAPRMMRYIPIFTAPNAPFCLLLSHCQCTLFSVPSSAKRQLATEGWRMMSVLS